MAAWCAPDADYWLWVWRRELGCGKLNRTLALQIAGMRAHRAPPVYLNVGANKGYEVAELLELWAPHLHITKAGWHRAIRRYAAQTRSGYLAWAAKGACNDGFAASAAQQPPASLHVTNLTRPRVYAFELHPPTARLLSHLVNTTGAADMVEVINMPVSDSSRPVHIPKQTLGRPAGTEGSQITESSRGKNKLTNVPATSIDDFLDQRHMSDETIESVIVDTEGHDFRVLRGMERALSRRRVRQIEFEYSRYGFWNHGGAESSLAFALTWLGRLGYFCFWQCPHGTLLPASPPCWRPGFEHKTWSNLRCAHEPGVLVLLEQAARAEYHRRNAHSAAYLG